MHLKWAKPIESCVIMGDMTSESANYLIVIEFLVIIVFIFWAITRKKSNGSRDNNSMSQEPMKYKLKYVPERNGSDKYKYQAKTRLMTTNELRFFRRLEKICASKYYIFPQIHLSAIVDHKVAGQSWRGAFTYINSWSVDFVLCRRDTMETAWVVELDDSSHLQSEVSRRDRQKEKIFADTGIQIVRFTTSESYNLSDDELMQRFVDKQKH